MEDTQADLVIFQEAGQPVQVRLDAGRDTVWLSQRQMGVLFDTTPENVLMHLKNIFQDGELPEQATTKDFLGVQTEGKRQVQRNLKHYNLDAIISVGQAPDVCLNANPALAVNLSLPATSSVDMIQI